MMQNKVDPPSTVIRCFFSCPNRLLKTQHLDDQAMHPLIPSASKLLGLPQPASSNTLELRETLIAELLPNVPENQTQETSLQTLGCSNITDSAATTNFLLTTLLAHRILQHKSPSTKHHEQDQALADALSGLTLALRLQPRTVTQSTLPSYIASLLPNLPHPTEPLSPSLNSDQISTLKSIQSRLQSEHLTRIELLLTRLNVTVSAFSRSRHAPGHAFFYDHHMKTMRRNAQDVSLYQAIAAGSGILKEPKRISTADDVKKFVMGAVPDRGGRLEGPFMPAFRGRVPSGVEMKAGNIKWKKGKGKGKGRRR